jgi:segregation and condensation protein B
MEQDQARKAIEALLYMTDHALTESEICEVLEDKRLKPERVREIVNELAGDLDAQGSPLSVSEVAGGFQMATRPAYAPYVRRMYKERLTVRLSASSLETLSIVAYKQPITRSEIEQIRGVEASGVMETLLERRLIKVVGRKETIGRPLLYGTTIEFLRHFGLRHLSELPDPNSLTPTDTVTAGDPGADDLPGMTGEHSPEATAADIAGEPAAHPVDSLDREVPHLETDAEIAGASVAVAEAAPEPVAPETTAPAEEGDKADA